VQGVFWRFAPTKPLPTYLAAFACGPFETIEAPQPDAPGITTREPMRMLLRGSQRRLADVDTLVRLHRDGLRWLAERFQVPYAFDKLDLVLLPGFPYGGMEHAGAIFYREQALVFDHAPTPAELVRRSTLVYHELCHQWFGNLVTMRWFDDLWLKEGFATFVGYQAMAALEPAQQPWLRFGQRVKPRAYEIESIGALEREVFGPILHVVRFQASHLDKVLEAINQTGYGLTLGVHSRIEAFAEEVIRLVPAGNVYINRGVTGAVVGVQPFGGEGLSGTGPKAGGPNSLIRYASEKAISNNISAQGGDPALLNL
jgi:hypothetical protein